MAQFRRGLFWVSLSAILSACTNSDEIVQTAAKYDIQQNERMHYEICVDDMANRALSFNGGAAITDGCACATKLILSEVEDHQMPIIWDYRPVEKIVDPERYEFVAKKYDLADSEADRLYRIVKSAFKLCERKTFHSRDMIAQISALKPRSLSAAHIGPTEPTAKLRGNSDKVKPASRPTLQLRGRSKG